MSIVIPERDMRVSTPRYGKAAEITVSEQTKERLWKISYWSGYPLTTLSDALLNIAMDDILPAANLNVNDSIHEWLKKNEVV